MFLLLNPFHTYVSGTLCLLSLYKPLLFQCCYAQVYLQVLLYLYKCYKKFLQINALNYVEILFPVLHLLPGIMISFHAIYYCGLLAYRFLYGKLHHFLFNFYVCNTKVLSVVLLV